MTKEKTEDTMVEKAPRCFITKTRNFRVSAAYEGLVVGPEPKRLEELMRKYSTQVIVGKQ